LPIAACPQKAGWRAHKAACKLAQQQAGGKTLYEAMVGSLPDSAADAQLQVAL
jgi:hypothetical protein